MGSGGVKGHHSVLWFMTLMFMVKECVSGFGEVQY